MLERLTDYVRRANSICQFHDVVVTVVACQLCQQNSWIGPRPVGIGPTISMGVSGRKYPQPEVGVVGFLIVYTLCKVGARRQTQ